MHRAFVDDAESEYTLARDWNSSSQTTFTKELVGKLLSGGVAGAVSRTATAPIDRVKTILQSGRLPEGLTGRSGTAASASADSTNSSSVTHKGTGTSTGKVTGTSTSRTVAAAVRGSKSNSHGYSKGLPPHVSPPTMRAAVRAIYREGGGFAFWRGNGANILKVVPETGVKFATFDALKHLIAVDPGNATTSERFVAGGIAGATAPLVIYPLEIVKTRMALSGGGGSVTVGSSHSRFTAGNSGTGGSGGGGGVGSGGGAFKPPPRVTIAGTLRAVLHESGPKGLFRGLTPSLVGIVPYAGIDLMANRYVPRVSQIQAPTFTDPL